MKYKSFVFGILIGYTAIAQQNFINVPSGVTTEKGNVFFQQQVNINQLLQSNATVEIGLGRGMEIGLNLLGLNFTEKGLHPNTNDTSAMNPYNPLLLMNACKGLRINKNFGFAVGAQYGYNCRKIHPPFAADLGYVNMFADHFLNNDGTVVAGLYVNSLHYGGLGSRYGEWLAAELPLNHRIHLMAETILGNNALSFTSFGVICFIKKNMPLTVGMQVPNNNRNAKAFVFEFTYLSKKKVHGKTHYS